MKNAVHDGDREKATSISKNLVPTRKILVKDPFFNKRVEEDKGLNLHAKDLFSLSQISSNKNYEADFYELHEIERVNPYEELRQTLYKGQQMKAKKNLSWLLKKKEGNYEGINKRAVSLESIK